MSDPIADLNATVARIRAEADAEGYARAWREISELAAARIEDRQTESDHARETQSTENSPGQRARRGINSRRVLHVLEGSKLAMSAQEIRRETETRELSALAYSSVQQALAQLETQGEAERNPDGRWILKDLNEWPRHYYIHSSDLSYDIASVLEGILDATEDIISELILSDDGETLIKVNNILRELRAPDLLERTLNAIRSSGLELDNISITLDEAGYAAIWSN